MRDEQASKASQAASERASKRVELRVAIQSVFPFARALVPRLRPNRNRSAKKSQSNFPLGHIPFPIPPPTPPKPFLIYCNPDLPILLFYIRLVSFCLPSPPSPKPLPPHPRNWLPYFISSDSSFAPAQLFVTTALNQA